MTRERERRKYEDFKISMAGFKAPVVRADMEGNACNATLRRGRRGIDTQASLTPLPCTYIGGLTFKLKQVHGGGAAY